MSSERSGPGLRAGFASGRVDWAGLLDFPVHDPVDRKSGDEALEALGEVLATASPEEVDETGEVPADLVTRLREGGFLALRNDSALGGRELSAYDAFRVVERACRDSVAIGQLLAVQSGVGVPALLPALPAGPLADHLAERVRAGALSGFAVTEPAGRNNTWPELTATSTEGGFLLHGEKLFTGNGTVAEVLAVTAVHGEGDRRRLCVCFVDTAAPGFEVTSRLEFAGSRGLPNGALRFDGVHVPADRVLIGAEGDPRMPVAGFGPVVLLGMLYFTAAPAVAIARDCLEWSRSFVTRRRVDGRELLDYEQVQQILALNAADVAALDSAARWSLLAEGRDFERTLLKNLCARTAWRVVDRTVSLFGGEGVETVRSKRRRGVDPVPTERALRDARGLRIAGNVDFRLDHTAMAAFLADGHAFATAAMAAEDVRGGDLSAANRVHLRIAAGHVRRFAEACADLSGSPDARQHPVALLGEIAGELLGVLTLLATTAGPSSSDSGPSQDVADIHCSDAEHRIADLWRRFDTGHQPEFAALARSVAARRAEEGTHR
ncbi:acyl-CoA dehydrogenase family protein [Saccharothrix obliqua]|uniref:acyl-CoA dehydrogenase family protein n=1 Tax=Saccharothrix obliqua TaxID=2861747 RepID=UPI001C5DE49F|nr:acyl-CoA dehydrogenase family protein [Saccharothrix obliqua]MBW4721554.1 acyl-CoA/acyl-ACP dehydrogenase [Saccharothrix obliqua]